MRSKLAVGLSAAMGIALLASAAAPAFAEDIGVGVSGSANVTVGSAAQVRADMRAQAQMKNESRSKDRAGQEIDRRVELLTKLSDRIGNMMRVSGDEKTQFSADIQAQIQSLQGLKAKIDADDSTTTLKDDVQSIVKDYRTFMLVMPKLNILAAVDRVTTIVSAMQQFGQKIQARISAAAAAGANVSAAQTAFSDYTAKLTEAGSLAAAAHDEVVNLQPDNGATTTAQANLAALKDARTKLHSAQQDLVSARKDINTIRQNLPRVNASATTTATASTSAQ